MSTVKSELILSLIDRISGPSRAVSAAMQRLNTAAARNAAAMDRIRGQIVDTVGAGYLLARSLAAPIKASVAFEDKMADIAKVADGLSPAGLKAMGDEIRKMSLRIPIAADGLADIVAAAAQSGIANDELLKFSELAAKVATAWDVSASSAGESMAKLKTALGRTVEDTALLADAINHLSNKTAASAPQILDVVKRVAPMASQFGMTAEQVAALGAAMTGSGFESEVAATSILNIGRALTKGGSATKRQATAFKRLGLTSKQVAKSMQKDAVDTLDDVLSRIAKIPADQRAALVSDLFGDEARALGPLISNGKLLSETMALIGEKSKYAGSAQAEFETRSKTTGNALLLFGNRLRDLSISIGDAFAPGLNKAMDVIGPFVTRVSELAQKFPDVTAGILTATGGLVAFRAAILALRFSGLFLTGSLIATAASFVSLGAVLAPVTAALTAVGGAIAAVTAPVWLGIAAGVALVAAAGAALYKYWDRIKAVVSGVAEAIGSRLQPVFTALQPVLDACEPVVSAIGSAFSSLASGVGNAWTKIQEFFSGFSSIFDREILSEADKNKVSANAFAITNAIIDAFAALPGHLYKVGSDIIQQLWDGMVAKFNEFIAWVQTIPDQIVAAVKNVDLSGIIKWPSMPSWLGGSDEPAGNDNINGTNATDTVKGGALKDVFSDRISPTDAYRSTRGANDNSRTSTTHASVQITAPITITGVADGRMAASSAASQLGAQVKAAVESANTD